MRLRTKVILFIGAVLGCTALLQRCNKPTTIDGPVQIEHKDGGNTVVIKPKGKPPIEIYQPDPKSTVITTDDKGNVVVKVRQFGVGLEPGLGIGYSDKLRIATDFRFVYYKRWGGHFGLGIATDPDVYKSRAKLLDLADPYLGISYVPWLRFSNTSLVASYTATKHVFVFVRFRF